MLISPPEDVYLSSGQQEQSRPYYLGHCSNKIGPVIIDEQGDYSQRMVASGTTESSPQHNKRNVSIGAAGTSSDCQMPGYAIDHRFLDEDEDEDLGSTTISPSYYYFYQPQHMPLSSPSNNNSSVTNNTPSNTTAESSYYSTRCQMRHVESQRTLQSLSTIDSIYTGYQPIQFDLPIIRVGMLSHIDASFLQRKFLIEEEGQ